MEIGIDGTFVATFDCEKVPFPVDSQVQPMKSLYKNNGATVESLFFISSFY